MMDEEIQEVLHFKTVWEKELEQRDALVAQLTTPAEASIGPDQIKTSMHKIEEQAIHFSEEDMEALVALPLKECTQRRLIHGLILFSPVSPLDVIADERPLLLALVDLMFAYCYNHRTTTGDHTVESAWTIAKLSPTIQWFDVRTSHSTQI
jgi:protein SHQ1